MKLPSPRLTAAALNLGRAALGAGILLAPDRAATLLIGGDADRPGVRVLTRMAGARDLALGLATLDALRARRPMRTLVLLGGLCDAVDLAAGTRIPGIPKDKRVGFAAAAGPAVAMALYAAFARGGDERGRR